jgi:hypothetical protein
MITDEDLLQGFAVLGSRRLTIQSSGVSHQSTGTRLVATLLVKQNSAHDAKNSLQGIPGRLAHFLQGKVKRD